MKRRFYLVLLVSIAGFIITSCKKEQLTPLVFQSKGTITNGNSPMQTISLVANDWKKNENNSYVHTFKNILTPPGYGKRVRVYLLTVDRELQINDPISFMSGQLWATYTTTDVKIVFLYSNALPFTSLDIKVVIE